MEIICLNNNIDLRKKMNNKKSFSFIYPLNNFSQEIFFSILKKVKKKTTYRSRKLKSLGRDLVFDKTIDDLLIADFKFLCSYKFSPNDYITISDFFEWFFIDNIPELNDSKINEARRFIILIDILYEKKKKLVIRAEKKLEEIFTLKKNKDLPFLRTASRITEMTAKKWIKI